MTCKETTKRSEEVNISFYITALKSHWRFICLMVLIGFCCAKIANVIIPTRYNASVLVMIDKENSGKLGQNSLSSYVSDETYYRTQYKLLKSKTLLTEVYHKLNLGNIPEFSKGLKSLEDTITITPVPRSRLVNIEVSSSESFLSVEIANTLAKTFVRQNIENRLLVGNEVILALESSEKSPADQEILNSLPQVLNNDFIKSLKREEATLESTYAKLSAKYTAHHPEIISVLNQLSSVRAAIERETKHILQSIKIELSGQFSANNIRIIDFATTPTYPKYPNKLLNTFIGIGAGLIIGLILSLFFTTISKNKNS